MKIGKDKTGVWIKTKDKAIGTKKVGLESANEDLTASTFVSSHDLQEPLRKIKNFAN